MSNRNANNVSRIACLTGLLCLSFGVISAHAQSTDGEATISSDEVELIDGGKRTVFTGKVLLERAPYSLRARKMTRYQDSGLVEADGKIIGIWKHVEGGKTEVRGEHARYDPKLEKAELWTDPGKKISVDSTGPRGSGRFTSERGEVDIPKKTVRMINHVQGRITPAPTPPR